jgi:hypothetical protein
MRLDVPESLEYITCASNDDILNGDRLYCAPLQKNVLHSDAKVNAVIFSYHIPFTTYG